MQQSEIVLELIMICVGVDEWMNHMVQRFYLPQLLLIFTLW